MESNSGEARHEAVAMGLEGCPHRAIGRGGFCTRDADAFQRRIAPTR
jgi:hypothetical protein